MPRVLVFSAVLLSGCASSTAIPPAWMSVPEAQRVRVITLGPDGVVSQVPRAPETSPVRVEANRIVRDGKPLTPPFTAIDSFDYSATRDEVVFSAKRDAGFDIGLVAGDGSAMNWVPADPADEVAVQWAPRGHKVSYIVRTNLGDVVRTLHIPTSFQFAVDFGPARIHALAWDPPAERYAVAYSTLDASDRVEVLRYEGKERQMAVPPSVRIAADVVAFAPDAYALRPHDLAYGEKLPAVIWAGADLAWSDARAALMKNARVASIVTVGEPNAQVWEAVGKTAWIDASRVYVVGTQRPQTLSIIGDASLPPGRYRRRANVVAVAPAAIQSFAAGFIADQLKRTGSTNGSSR
ncbi:MAG TPA: hypothetical protein VHK90_02535 [Thermoanaerobaculia bacterium]|nr:hypothetical protein [Thermoanaerobaculia bacterium]